MKVEGHRKQVALFLIAVLLPVIVLVALTLRMVTQERELALKRVADEHRRMAAEIGRGLTSRLDGIARGEASAIAGEPLRLARRDYRNPEVVLVAKIDEARLVLPWEIGRKAAAPGPHEDDSAFSRTLRQAESTEFSSKNYPLAAARYRRAAAAARLPAEEGYARLQRARTLSKMKREEESLSEYEQVLFLSPEVVDEYGIPLSLYAVEQLLRRESIHPQAVEQIGRQLVGVTWRSPAGLYLLRDLVQQIIAGAPIAAGTALRSGAEDNLRKILAQIQVMEQALSLKEDFPRLGLEPMPGRDLKTAESLWVSYGQKPWLVGLSPRIPGEGGLLVAVDFQTFNSSLASDAEYSAKYASDRRASGRLVGRRDLPGARPPGDPRRLRARRRQSLFETRSAPTVFLLPGPGRRPQRDVVRGVSPVAGRAARGPHGPDAVAVRLQRLPRAQDAPDGHPDVRGDSASRPVQGSGHAGRVPGYDRQRERAPDPAPKQRPRFFKDRAGPKDLPSGSGLPSRDPPGRGPGHGISFEAAGLRSRRPDRRGLAAGPRRPRRHRAGRV